MKRWLLAAPVLLLAASSAPKQETRYPPDSRCTRGDRGGACTLYTVSIVELIANPRLYDGKRVQVTGWLHLEFEGNGIYLHRDDQVHGVYANGLWVSIPARAADSGCSEGYALVEGTFDAGAHGHRGMWSGTIDDIGRCMPWQ